MSSDIGLIANRYVNALYELAKSGKQLDKVKSDFITLEWVIGENRELQRFLVSPVVTVQQSGQLIDRLLESIKACELTRKFFAVVVAQRRLGATKTIINRYLQKLAESRGQLKVQLVSATPLSAAQSTEIHDIIATATGKKVELRKSEDKSLIGGIQVRIGSRVFDSSIAGKLARLKLALTKAA